MNDWADRALKRLSDQQINTQTQNDLFLERQRVKKAFGVPLWMEVRKSVEDNCADFNTKAKKQLLAFEAAINTELSVRANLDGGTRSLHASYDEPTGKLSWSSGKSRGAWTIEPTKDGKAEFVGSHGPTTVEWITDEMLTALI